ncbi:MAG: endolytic transglycosylase MltG [Bacteroidales bacterium]|nr:endolytic transglycosylase MltG [Bacteroidales bacterium]
MKKEITYSPRMKILLAAAIAVAAGLLVFGGFYIRDHKMSNFRGDFVLFISDTCTTEGLLKRFESDTLCKSYSSLKRAFRAEDMEHHLRIGRYEIKQEHSSIEMARMIKRGWQRPCKLTLSGTIRTKQRLAGLIGTQMMVDSVQVMEALNDDAFLAQFGFDSRNVYSMILPDTYEMYWNATIYEIFKRFYEEYDAFWNETRQAKAQKLKLTPMEVSILASIVSGETNRKDEYPYVARVYLNRLDKNMKLQACPTICYLYDYKLNRVLRTHLKVDSPYNTYMYLGLPPGPISVPPKACIDAVLNPAEGNYLYFSANPAFDGTNRFAASYSEHQRMAKEYHKAISERQKNQGK